MLRTAGVVGLVGPFVASAGIAHTLAPVDTSQIAGVATTLQAPAFERCLPFEGTCYAARWRGLVAGVSDRDLYFSLAEGGSAARTVRLSFGDAQRFGPVVGEAPLQGVVRSYVALESRTLPEPRQRYARLRVDSIQPGVGLALHASPTGFEYDLILDSRAAVERIRLRFAGADKVELTDVGDLMLHVGTDTILHRAPVVWREGKGGRTPVEARLRKTGIDDVDIVLELPADMAEDDTLVVDPDVEYAGFVGGSASYGAEATDVDPAGNIYLAGTYRARLNAPGDATLTKLDPDGNILYTSILGGSGDDMATGVAVAPDGSVYVTGVTCSADFPVVAAAQPTYHGNCDAFVARLDAATGALAFSTYLGGSGSESPFVGGLVGFPHPTVAVDAVSNAHVVGATRSFDFPVVSPAFPSHVTQTGADAFYAAYAPDGTLLHSTLLGGSGGDDAAYAVTIDSRGNAIVAGTTSARDFPLLNSLKQQGPAAGREGFVTAFAPNGAVILSTLLGGAADDEVFGVAADDYGSVYLTGYTRSSDFPRTSGSGSPGAYSNAFLTRLDLVAPGPGPGSPLVPKIGSSVTFGGQYFDVARGVRVDPLTGDAFVTGFTYSYDFPVVASPLSIPVSNDELFVAKLSEGGGLQYSVLLGSSSYDYGNGIALTSAREAVAAGVSWSATFPGGASGSVSSTSGNVSTGHSIVAKVGTGPPSCTLDIDGDGLQRPETDGLLLLRYMFGFRGAPLTLNALGAGATRSTPEDVAAFIAAHYYDVDGNGAQEPLTDGLTLVRHLFGTSNGNFTHGAIGEGARRNTQAQITAWLDRCDVP